MIISIDGDNIGKRIEGMILTNNLEQLERFSNNVSSAINNFALNIERIGGKCYLCGGDNILAFIPDSAKDEVINTVLNSNENELFFSAGLGSSVLEAYLALKIAKSKLRGCICIKNGSQVIIQTRQMSYIL